MTEPRRNALRCAIYTRKSSEEGLEQEFNSLEAQREACEAYIRSQAHECWKLVAERFDDGGFSGGSMDRPALQRLLERIRDNRVDVIIIYKIDRLTRSLMDFAKLAELFDKQGVSFVSVTQQFNTTTSMGRLMLNVLLSFAQFEREITGERIRDKIAASKKKGMWMGGAVPLGYDNRDRMLIINETEAQTVRALYALYLKLGNVHDVWREAGRLNLRTKIRTYSNGKSGGGPFFPGHIYWLLKSPIYAGRIIHKGATYAGNHEAIIDTTTWDTVQKHLAKNRVGRRGPRNAKSHALLSGLLFDAKGNRYIACHTAKGDRRYRYYVDQVLLSRLGPSTAKLPRIPAPEIETVVRKALGNFLNDPTELLKALRSVLHTRDSGHALNASRKLHDSLSQAPIAMWKMLTKQFLRRVVIGEANLVLHVAPDGLIGALSAISTKNVTAPKYTSRAPMHEIVVSAQIRTRGNVMKLVIGSENRAPDRPDVALIKAIARAHSWFEQLKSGKANSLRDIARVEGVTESYVARMLRLAFLAPEFVDQIIRGQQPVELTVGRLSLREDTCVVWNWHG